MKEKNIWALIAKYRIHIMGAAALWIFAFHEWRTLFENWGAIGTAVRFFFGIGFAGVDIFLLLSGMGLTYAIDKYSLGKFYRRRFLRVLLPCVLTLTGMMLLRGWDFLCFLKVVSGYSFYFESMYTALWFSFAILALYLVFPFYYALFRKASHKVLFTALMLLIWYGASAALIGTLREDLYGFSNRIPIFLVGILCGWMAQEKKLVFTWKYTLCCGAALLMGFALSFLTRYQGLYLLLPDSSSFAPNFLMAIGVVFLLPQVLALLEKYCAKLAKYVMCILAFYGAMSFEFYCIQELVPNFGWDLFPDAVPAVLVYAMSFAAMSAMSCCFAKVCGWLSAKLK